MFVCLFVSKRIDIICDHSHSSGQATDSQLLQAGCPLAQGAAANDPPSQNSEGVVQSTTPEGAKVEETLEKEVGVEVSTGLYLSLPLDHKRFTLYNKTHGVRFPL